MKRLILTVLNSILLSITGLVVVRYLVSQDALASSNDVVGSYLQVLGTIYAVLLAFVVFVVWNQFNEARNHVEQEANELADLVRIARCLHLPSLLKQAREYVRIVIEEEWAAMACRKQSENAQLAVEHIWTSLEHKIPRTDCETALYAEALTRFNGFNDARTDRLYSSRTRLPTLLWALLLSGGIVTVASMYLFGVKSFGLHALLTGALGGSIAHVLYLIWDFDNCFSGNWHISAEPFKDIIEQMNRTNAVAGPCEDDRLNRSEDMVLVGKPSYKLPYSRLAAPE